jgi:hypothetical protein|nr:MAG TPA: hypothetical protein [Caudoviricetes sp.]
MLVEQIKIEYDGVITYMGISSSQAAVSDNAWHIIKIEHDAAGKVISVLHSGGIHDQIYSWNDRASLEYR